MNNTDLFEQQLQIADKIKGCIRDKGYTKVSFAKISDINIAMLETIGLFFFESPMNAP